MKNEKESTLIIIPFKIYLEPDLENFPIQKLFICLVFSLNLKMSKKSIKDYFNVAQLENHGPNHSQKATIIQTRKLACFI